jgi:CBS domain containing-hemolysin-like protein
MIDLLIAIGVILLLVMLNGFFVASEFALVTVRKTRIDQLANEGNSSARMVQKALHAPNIVISATQLGVTMATLVLGSAGEPLVTAVLESWFGDVEWIFVSSKVVAFIVSYALITAIEIIIGELVPKAIAGRQTERTALIIIRPLALFLMVFRPFIFLLDAAAKLVLGILHIPPADEHASVHSEEELKMLVTASTEGGVLEASEEQMLHRVLDFGDRLVHEVMVPRTEMVTLSADITLFGLLHIVTEDQHTRFPVYENSPDNIIGVVHAKDVLTLLHGIVLKNSMVTLSKPIKTVVIAPANNTAREHNRAENRAEAVAPNNTIIEAAPAERAAILQQVEQIFDVRKLVRPVIVVPDTMRVEVLMTEMKKRKNHLAIAIDEYGGTAGLVTLEDLLEEIVGDVNDEFDETEEANFRPQPDGTVLVSGLVMLGHFNDYFKTDVQDPIYDTIAGFVLGQLGRKPEVGDEVTAVNLKFRVEQMEGLRIALLRVIK